jgi:hypothetical protein
VAVRRHRPINYPTIASAVGWGNITGTLSNQTDLQAALDALAPTGHTHVIADITDANDTNWDTAYGWGDHSTNNYAVTTANETIDGTWTYNRQINSDGTSTNPDPFGRTIMLYRSHNSGAANYMRVYNSDIHFALYDGGTPTDVSKGIYLDYDTVGTSKIDIDGTTINATTITNWNTAYGWGDPSGVYQPLDGDLTAIAALVGTSGFLKKTAADTWTYDCPHD